MRRPRKRYLLLAAVLGLAVAVMPALAASSTAKLEVNENCVQLAWPCWTTEGSASRPQPASSVTIASGGSVMFVDHGKEANIAWIGSAPACEPSVPVAPAAPKTNWEGKCTFATPGTYKFESATMFKEPPGLYSNNIDYTKYEVLVGGTPTDITTSASGEAQTEATLNGSINPQGNTTVEYHFEYEGPGITGKQSTASTTLSAADFTSHVVTKAVTGLQPGMTYKFELVATYGAGKTPVSGGLEQFTTHAATAPAVATLAAEGVKETAATLKGTVNPGGEATEYFFEYGTDTSYAQKTGKATLPASGRSQAVSVAVNGLTVGTEYHFRLVAENKHGPEKGLDQSFKTMSASSKEPTQGTSPTPTPTLSPTGGNPTAMTSSSPLSGQPRAEPAPGSPFGSVKLASTQHSPAVHGTVDISGVGAGGRLEVTLLTTTASLAKAGHSSKVRIGRFLRSSLQAGVVSFTVPLTAKAKVALRRHKHLALSVRIVLTPLAGAPETVSRNIVLRG